MTCVGMCKRTDPGRKIFPAEGEYIEHPVYGRQFKIQSYETVTPTDAWEWNGIWVPEQSGESVRHWQPES